MLSQPNWPFFVVDWTSVGDYLCLCYSFGPDVSEVLTFHQHFLSICRLLFLWLFDVFPILCQQKTIQRGKASYVTNVSYERNLGFL